ncbi:monovalent cation/H+ antiporter subunit D [Erythrobacteraceae bacterium CFH 75059]|uniref:monovalent cation/H+ antiporter subunit D n=1 Tax=Qipengyuania thermophila TaxID=2509361 RepID=UPI00101EF7FC|nr:monovalent cation/H+ antiporter subunit D [Qipengyuania thermophila]TCD06557.1 monovalent cation/H+ antiporter subunit D [Erythrobacteraceae bacterium CFH 75059]
MHLIVAPVLVPAVLAALMLLRPARLTRLGQRLSILAMLAQLAIAVALIVLSADGEVRVYELGSWPAPYGIVLVLDRLAALMLLLASVLGLAVLAHAVLTRHDQQGWHFHPLFQFQMLGLNGAFLTGDLFNLFVFFEVLLIASYGLLLHGQGAARLQAGVQYVVVNLVGSTIFLVAIGVLYGTTGTLNFADMALRVSTAPPEEQALIRAGAQILIAVFALKAALLPLHLWLPRAYASTSAPVAALFAILTKVGVYSIIRVTTLVFGEEAGAAAWAPAGWLLPAALLSVLVGFVGLLAARELRLGAAFGVIGSTGTLMVAASVFTPETTAAALFYLPHSTLAAALLFLVADLVLRRRGERQDRLEPGPSMPGAGLLAVLFLLSAIALAGLPPLSGFVGKLLILASVADNPAAWWIWGTILVTTFLAILALARAGSVLFWTRDDAPPHRERVRAAVHAPRLAAPALMLVAALGALTVFAGPATAYTRAAADQLHSRTAYITAVLPDSGVRR